MEIDRRKLQISALLFSGAALFSGCGGQIPYTPPPPRSELNREIERQSTEIVLVNLNSAPVDCFTSSAVTVANLPDGKKEVIIGGETYCVPDTGYTKFDNRREYALPLTNPVYNVDIVVHKATVKPNSHWAPTLLEAAK